MEFEEEVVEYEVETVEYEEVEVDIPEIEFEEDTVDVDFDTYEEVEVTETEEVEFTEDVFEEEVEVTEEVEEEEFEEDTFELPEEAHFTDDEENMEIADAPQLFDGDEVTDADTSADEEIEEDFTEELEADVDVDEDEDYDMLTPEERAQVNEMNENGEMDYKPSDLGDAYTWHDGPTMENAVEVDMPYNPDASYDSEEFIGQAQMQEDGLNSMTVAEYLDNYENYQENGRSPEGSEMQAQYRDGLVASNAYDMMEADPSLSAEEAERLADEELKGGAALHNPDQVAGGDPTDIHAYGSGKANSAMGSLWGHGRADDMYNQIKEQTQGMTREEMENTHLNVHFNIHEKE